jgi:hypothetical protein
MTPPKTEAPAPLCQELTGRALHGATLNDSQPTYTGSLPLASPAVPLPESTGDRATLQTMLAWFGSIEHPGTRGRPTSSVRLVWTALFAHADVQTGHAYPSLPRVAALCALSLRCVRSCVRKLEALGLVRNAPRPGRATVYRLTLPATSTPARAPARAPSSSTHPHGRTPARNTTASTPRTPATSAATPAPYAGQPRHGMPPEQLREQNKKPLHAPDARTSTPAQNADLDPGTAAPVERAAASGCAPAPPTAPAEPAEARGRAEASSSPTARPARQARAAGAAALVAGLSAAWTPPGTPAPRHELPRHETPPVPAQLDPGTPARATPAPSPHPGTSPPPDPSPPPPALAAVIARVAQRHAAAGGGRR